MYALRSIVARGRQWLLAQPGPERRMRTTARDLRGALGVFVLVFGSTFPVVLPFVFMTDLQRAMRVSAAVMVLAGAIIQAAVIALGG